MDKSRHELSFDRFQSVNRSIHGANASVKIKVTHRGVNKANLSSRMNTSETVPPHLLMQNVRDIRKRLQETEKTLNKISKAETKLENE